MVRPASRELMPERVSAVYTYKGKKKKKKKDLAIRETLFLASGNT
jgi:hypothetical protein